MSVQWLPDRVLTEGRDFSVQRLILGTHTSLSEEEAANPASAAASATAATGTAAASAPSGSSGSATLPQNYLMIAEVRLPHGDPALTRGGASNSKPKMSGGSGSGSNKCDAMQLDDGGEGGGGAAAASASSAFDLDGVGGAYVAQQGRIKIVQNIPHKGEVNRARYSPHNPNLIATKSPHANVFVFDRSKHSSNEPPTDFEFKPDLVLEGHTAEGYGLAWNPHAATQGLLLSGSNDHLVCMWDVSAAAAGASKKRGSSFVCPPIQPLHTFRAHSNVVEDVAWSNFHPEQFASCGDDQRLLLWDTRTPQDPTASLNKASQHHTGNINCISFNHFTEFILASGASQWTQTHTHKRSRSL